MMRIPCDPLTGLPLISVREALRRVLAGVNPRTAVAVAEKLRAGVPTVEIAGAEFFSWREFVAYLERVTTEGAP